MSEVLYQKLCAKAVREEKSLFQCSNELDLGLTRAECNDLEQDINFQRVLRGERLRFYKELASDPQRSKSTAIGQLLMISDRLMAKGSEDKAAAVIMNVAKMEGWLEDRQTVNVFGDVSQADINKLRERIAKAAAVSSPSLMN